MSFKESVQEGKPKEKAGLWGDIAAGCEGIKLDEQGMGCKVEEKAGNVKGSAEMSVERKYKEKDERLTVGWLGNERK